MNAEKEITVRYFALLREQSGKSSESYRTGAGTVRDLYDELRARYGFKLDPQVLKVAVNAEFTPWDAPLKQGDTVVFLPPVAGG